MATSHHVTFPRYTEEIYTQRRTLLHWGDLEDEWSVGDELVLVEHPSLPRVVIATITKVSKVKIFDIDDADFEKLNLGPINGHDDRERARVEYWRRLNACTTPVPAETNPTVWRIEFSYGHRRAEPDHRPDPITCLAG